MLKFKTLEAARAFFNTMHVETEVGNYEGYFNMRTYDVEIEEIGKPVKVTVGDEGDFFIMAEGLFSDEACVSDICVPLPERIQKLLHAMVFKGYTPPALLLAIHDNRLDAQDAEVPPNIEEQFPELLKQQETMLELLA